MAVSVIAQMTTADGELDQGDDAYEYDSDDGKDEAGCIDEWDEQEQEEEEKEEEEGETVDSVIGGRDEI
ncbi:hypothetical protein BGZ47_011777 [Haplosporangium gracile]|nr:hypothetical protein BGZ47_011777 [Haplosporangium gracile]